jgi:hypothetical protein
MMHTCQHDRLRLLATSDGSTEASPEKCSKS